MSALSDPRPGAAPKAYRIVLGLGLLLVLAANLPGHLSVDSVIALVEARTNVRQTWAPAAFSWVLRKFDAVVSGTGLYVTVSSALLFFSLAVLGRLRPRVSWGAVVMAALVILTPQILIYQGIVWRDVLFANLSVAGFVFLAHAAKAWGGPRPWIALGAALLCLSLAAMIRQNGLIMVVAAAAALGWTARGAGWRSILAWSLGWLAAAVIVSAGIHVLAKPNPPAVKMRDNAGVLILQHYDIAGMIAHRPDLTLDLIAKVNPDSARFIEEQSPRVYSQLRVDTLDANPRLRRSFWRLPDEVMGAQWRALVLENPGVYLAHRVHVFRWALAAPDVRLCLPVHVGVQGPEAILSELGVVTGAEQQDLSLAAYAQRFYGTPIFSHLAFGALALVVAGLLLRRGDPADSVMAALLLGAVAFAGSFLLISVACDYRYLYLLDLAALTGAIYFALDPPRLRRAR